MRYLCAIGAPWGSDAFRLAIGAGVWASASSATVLVQSLAPTPRYVFFLNWSQRVPRDLVEQVECVNFHCSALPAFRGGHPIERQIQAGLTETVITAHRMTVDLDAGPIYGTRGPVSLEGTKEQIQQRFVAPVAELMRWIVRTEPQPVSQTGEATTFTRLSPLEYQQFWAARG